MADTKTLTATLPDGRVVTRTTSRSYTHVVCFTYDVERIAESTRGSRRTRELNESSFAYALACANGTHSHVQPGRRSEENRKRIIAEAEELVAKYGTAEAYHNAMVEQHIATFRPGSWVVEGWCCRFDSAERLASRVRGGNRLEVRIVLVREAGQNGN
ncbi:MAG: hypothetical protein AAFR84_01050 [Pseudomonadota bacterium]